MSGGRFTWIRTILVSVCLLTPVAEGQTGQGTIVGLVTDTTSAVITGVAVTAKNPETGFTYAAQTNEEGLYRILYVNPGVYEMTFEAQGFKKLVRGSIRVRSTETARADARLEVGAVLESVEVKADAPLLEVETSTAGHLITGEILNKLSSPQLNIYSIPWLFPGVTSQSGWGHAAGQRSRAFNVDMDGVPSVEPVRGQLDSGNRAITPVEDLIGEVKILTTVLPAEYGHTGSGIMNINYRSGTNQLHGLAKERYMSKSMLHRNWQDPVVPTNNPLGYHMMTATISGPVVLPKIYNGRNKTFFLAGFQRHHEKTSENNDRDVPSPAMYGGDFSFGGIGDPIYDPATLVRLPNGSYSRSVVPGNRIPQNRFDPAVQRFLGFSPWKGEINRNNQAFLNRTGPHNNLSADTKAHYYLTSFDEKLDHSFSDKHKIFGRYSNYRRRGAGNGRWQIQVDPIFDYNVTDIPSNQRQVAISDSLVINPATINEIRVAVNRRKFTRLPASLNEGWAGKIGIPNVGPETMPSFLTAGGGQLYSRFPEGATVDVTENFSAQENLTMVRGRHSFKTGYEILRTRANSKLNAQPSGRLNFGGTEFPFTPNTGHDFASFLLGGVVRAEFTKDLATWLPQWWNHSLYFQDDWKVTPSLTLNLGVRWQVESPFQTKYGQQSQFSPEAVDPLTGLKGAILHPTGPLSRRDWNNFQPRVGMAYSFKKDWVFRAGLALNTLDLWTNGLQENFDEYLATTVFQRPPGDPEVAFYLAQGPPAFRFNVLPNGTSPFVGTNFSGRGASYFDPNMRAPYIMNWNAGFQRQLTSTMLVEASYQGSSGIGLLNGWDVNAIPLNIAGSFDDLDRIRRASQNFRPYSQFGSILHYSNYGHNSFHSGTIRFEKRHSHGLTLSSFYTRSKALDESSGDGGAGGVTFYNRGLEKGRSDYDVTNRWVTYAAYELPIGKGRRLLGQSGRLADALFGNWNLNVIQTLENGAPFSFSFAGTSNVYLPGTLRPDIAPGKTYQDIKIPWDSRGPCRHIVACALPWADINAFAYPASFRPGQSGRNIQTGAGILWHQVSVAKEFHITERLRGGLRYDVNNPFKRYFFSRPGTAVDFRNPQNFGKITASSGSFSGLGGRLYQNIEFKVEF